MYQQGRSLLKSFEKQPFAIVGVNTDLNRNSVKQVLAKENVTWRSFWDGGPEGPISSRWNIEGFPTMFLIDHAGMLVGKVQIHDGKIFGQLLTDGAHGSVELLSTDAKVEEVIGRLVKRAADARKER